MTVAASTKGSTTIDYVPQNLIVVFNGGVVNSIQAKSQSLGVLLDVDGAGLKMIGQSMRQIAIGDNIGFIIPLANGYVNRSLNLAIDAGAGGTIEVYGSSFAKGTAVMETLSQEILASTKATLSKFTKAFMDHDPADQIIVNTREGSNDFLEPDEVSAYNATQAHVPTGANEFLTFDNTGQLYSNIQVIPATLKKVYIMRVKERIN